MCSTKRTGHACYLLGSKREDQSFLLAQWIRTQRIRDLILGPLSVLLIFLRLGRDGLTATSAEAESVFRCLSPPIKPEAPPVLLHPLNQNLQRSFAIESRHQSSTNYSNTEKTSKLALLAFLIIVMLLAPSIAATRVGPTVMGGINVIQTEHIELPELVIGPESVAFDRHDGGPYVSVSHGRILK
jgi:hypothetical protein